MSTFEQIGYYMVVTYLCVAVGLAFFTARLSDQSIWLYLKKKEPWPISAFIYGVAFLAAAVWPLVVAQFPHLVGVDPIRATMDGVAGDIISHSLCGLGAAIAISSQAYLAVLLRTGDIRYKEGPILDAGPFAFSRNPIFVGQLMILIGLFLAFPNILQMLLTIGLIITIALRVRMTERALANTLGNAYFDFCRRVPRWF